MNRCAPPFSTRVPLLVVLAVGLASSTAEPARAASATVNRLLGEGKIMLARDVKRGMIGVGKSVFVGTKIESFHVEILGVLEKEIAGGDVILFRVTDGPVVQRRSGIIGGMSGSPVYINGKLIGAIAYGWPFPREPIGGITPIAQMIEATEQLASPLTPAPFSRPPNHGVSESASGGSRAGGEGPVRTAKLAAPLRVAGRAIGTVRIDSSLKSRVLPERSDEMVLRPVSVPIMVSGFSRNGFNRVKTLFEEFNMEPFMGGGSAPKDAAARIEPGAVAALEFARGDLAMAGGGTITFVEGDRVWAFGHPFMEMGPMEFPLSSGYVVDWFPSLIRSNKFITPIKPVGTITADSLHAIGGKLGPVPKFIPMTVTVRDRATGLTKKYESQIVDLKQLTPRLITTIGADAMESVYGQQLEKTVRVSLKVEAEGVAPIERSNILFSPGPSINSGLVDLAETVDVLQGGEQVAKLKKIELTTELISKRKSARIKRMFVDKARVKPGEELEVGVVLEPLRGEGEPWTETFKLTVPKDSPGGVMRIGASNGRLELLLQSRLGATVTVPRELKDLVDFYQSLHNNNDLVVKAALPRIGALVDDRKLPMTPAGVLNVMTRSRSTTLGNFFRDQITVSKPTEWSLAGSMHIISLLVDSKRRPPEGAFALPPNFGPPTGPGGPGPGGAPPPPSSVNALLENEGVDTRLEAGAPIISRLDVRREWRQLANWSRQYANYLVALDLQQVPPRVPPPGSNPNAPPIPPSAGPGGSNPPPGGAPRPGPGSDPARGTGRPNRSWVQSADSDFMQGTFMETAVTSRGEVVLAPKPQLLFAGEQPLVLALASDTRGTVYAGTGNDGTVLTINPGAKPRISLETKDLAVTALAVDAQNNVYAGSAPSGRIFKITPEGKSSVFYETRQSYVWALRMDQNGNLLAATGNRAQLLRITPAGQATVVASFPQEHARALAADAAGNLFVGTGEDGVLYRIAPNGTSRAVYSATDGEIGALTANAKGEVFFGTSANGTIWRWTPGAGGDGEVEAVYRSPQQAVYALTAASDGSVYAGTGDRGIVYRVFADKHVARALEPVQGQATSLALEASGQLLVGTANGAAIYRLGLPNSDAGVYDSAIDDAAVEAKWLYLRWQANEGGGSYVTLQTRSGNTREPDEAWSAWSEAYADPEGSLVTSPPGRFIQYRATLVAGPNGESPALARAEVVYRTKNQPPTFQLVQGPRGGEEWSGTKLIVWQGRDPDNDVLTYKVYVQALGESAWQLAGESRAPSYSLDTTKYKDGVFRLKMLVTDEASNPGDAQTYEEVTKPLVLDNTPPVATIVSVVAQSDGSVKVEGTATDELSRIASVDYRIDSGDTLAALPSKGAFDSRSEKFHFTTAPLKGKTFTIEVRVKDSAGNTSVARREYAPAGVTADKK